MSCGGCERTVRTALEKVPGVENVRVDLATQRVLVDSLVPDEAMVAAIAATGKRVRVVGHGSSTGASLGQAVAELRYSPCKGIVRLTQLEASQCIVEGALSGLAPGTAHTIAIHEYGDLSDDWRSTGSATTPAAKAPLIADAEGKLAIFETVSLHVADAIGRAFVVQVRKDLKNA